jgi:hypothetical protein
VSGVPAPEIGPHCGGTEFRSLRIADTVGVYGVRSRPAQKCANVTCGLRFDASQWTFPDTTPFEMAESGT